MNAKHSCKQTVWDKATGAGQDQAKDFEFHGKNLRINSVALLGKKHKFREIGLIEK